MVKSQSVTTSKDSIDYNSIYGSYADSIGRGSKNSTNFVQVFENPRLFELSAGMNFLNILRGQTPDLNIAPSFITANPIAHNYLLVIDGVPYNSDISYFANLNAFDFDKIVVLSPVNGAVDFGMVGGNGGTLLSRKSGNGIKSPQLEFNSFSTVGWFDQHNSPFPKKDRFQLSNSLAFAQDFGRVDTRLSYNHTTSPAREDDLGALARAIKMHTGLELSRKLHGSIVFETHKQEVFPPKALPPSVPNGSSNFRTVGMEIVYQPLKWLSLQARATQDDLEASDRFDIITSFFSRDPFYINQKRELTKYSLQTRHSIKERFRITPTIAYQQENIEYELNLPGQRAERGTRNIRSAWGGITTSYNEIFTFDLSHRIDENNFVKDKKISVSSVAASWNFTKLVNAENIISFGRLRSNFGHRNGSAAHPALQIFQEMSFPSFYQFYSSQSGIDLSLLKNRIHLSYNHYLLFDKSFGQVIIDENRFQIIYRDFRSRELVDGDEIIIGSYPFGTKDWYTKLIWSRPNLVDSNSLPDWLGSLYIMRDWKGFQLSTVISYQKGGELFANHTSYSASSVGLRDLSISHKAFFNDRNKFGLREISVSLSARNLARFAASGAGNVELNGVTNGMYNSFTLNISGKLF